MIKEPLFTSARRAASCPRCGAKPGETCRNPSGRAYTTPHTERMKELRRVDPGAWDRATFR